MLPSALVLSLALAAAPSAAAAASDPTVRLRLDARTGNHPVTTPASLKRGVQYIATVEGTFSYYAAATWLGRTRCGPAIRPIFASPGVRNTYSGADTEFTFAGPGKKSAPCGTTLFKFTNFGISTGFGFSHRQAIGLGATPNPQHRYRYLLQGRGKPARFRLRDGYTKDNFGVVHITIRRAPKGYTPPAVAPTTPAVVTPGA